MTRAKEVLNAERDFRNQYLIRFIMRVAAVRTAIIAKGITKLGLQRGADGF